VDNEPKKRADKLPDVTPTQSYEEGFNDGVSFSELHFIRGVLLGFIIFIAIRLVLHASNE
jgi:hypothetical protein